jgi:Fe2+ transport system protein B
VTEVPAPNGSEMPPAGEAVAGPARRPPAVTILAVLQLITAAAYGLIVIGMVVGGPPAVAEVAGRVLVAESLIGELRMGFVLLVLGILFVACLAAGVLLLRMRRLGWTITMLIAGLGLATSVYLWWFQGTRLEFWLVVQIVTVFYLNQRQVRHAFGISGGRLAATLGEGRG